MQLLRDINKTKTNNMDFFSTYRWGPVKYPNKISKISLEGLCIFCIFRHESRNYEVNLSENLFHNCMDDHGCHLHHYYTFVFIGMDDYVLVGQTQGGYTHDGNVLGVALSVFDYLLETSS